MKKIIAGVDEVGRGSLIGPVYAAAVNLKEKINTKLLKDSKLISKERGRWKEVIIKQKNYKAIVTFHPAYLLRKSDQKKFSWEDLKIIRKEIDHQNIVI